MRRRGAIGLVVGMAAAFAAVAAPAVAHVQVLPTVAAPGDPVLWEVIVPGETEARTTEVALQIPEGVLPFSWEETPGWRREVENADDGSVAVVRWRGRIPSDGFVRFAFLASTPEEEGELSWKAVQTYDDGTEAAWIEEAGGERPAPVTRVSADAPRQNAGGEGAEASGGGDQAEPAPTAAAAPAGGGGADDDDGGGTLAIVLGAAGAVMGAAALLLVLLRRAPAERREASA